MTSSAQFDVIGIGGAAWDFLGLIKDYPEPGEKAEMSFIDQQGGGQVGTATVTVARLGGKVAIAGTTGDDEFGEKIRQSFIEEGVDISHLLTDKDSTSHIAFCLTNKDSGNRTIFYNRGTKRLLAPEDIDSDFINNCRCLLVDTHHSKAALKAVKIASKAHIPIVTDIERYSSENDELFQFGTHHILPVRYLLEYTGEKALQKAVKEWQKKFFSSILVVTLGEEGSLACEGDKVIKQNIYNVSPVVDTTGAGDVFHGAFAYGLTLGYELKKNLKFSSLVAGLKCRSLGGRKGIPKIEELNKIWLLQR
jgi:sulfofructose kinase